MKKYKIIIDFLKIIGADREASHYLKLFQKGDPKRFAVIKIGGGVLENSNELIAMDLAYLSNLSLYPIVIHGGGPQIDKALAESRIRFKKIAGQRVTTRKQISIVQRVLNHINADLVKGIRKFNGSAIGLTEDIFVAEKHPNEKLGYVGNVKKVNLAPIIRAIKNKKIPVISCLGFDEEGRIYNINADTAAKSAVLAIKPKKYVSITEEGGIRDKNWDIISNLNISEEFDELERDGILNKGMLHKIREIKNLLEQVRYNLPVQLTSSRGLLRELFTNKGSGTFIKLGEKILEYQSYSRINRAKLKKLLEKGFDKTLKDNYFEKPISYIFLDKRYRGVAVVRSINRLFYLDKFCVTKEAQGEGIASDLWHHVTSRCKNLFWRAKPTNPICSWYFEKSQGVFKFDEWFFFWINLTEEEIKEATAYALDLEESFLTD